MTLRSVLALALVTLAAMLAALFVWMGERGGVASSERGTPIVPALSARDAAIGTIQLETPRYELELVREGERWIAAGQAGYPASTETVNRLLSELGTLKAWEPRTATPVLYGAIGVDAVSGDGQSRHVRLVAPDGAPLADLLVGIASRSIGANPDGGVFVRRPDEAQAWLAEGRVTIPVDIGGWFEPVLHIAGPDLQKIELREGDRPVLSAAKPEGGVAYEAVSAGSADTQVDDAALKRLGGALVSAAFIQVRPASEVNFEANARRLVFTTSGGLRIEMQLGQADGASWVTVTASAEGGDAAPLAEAINRRAEGRAFRFDDGKMAALETPLAELIQPSP